MMAPPSVGIFTKKQLDFNALDLTNEAFFCKKTFCLKMAKKTSQELSALRPKRASREETGEEMRHVKKSSSAFRETR